METWLKLIGSSNAPVNKWKKHYVGFHKNKPSIRTGDRLFLYAPGVVKNIFALGRAASDPNLNSDYDPDKEGSCRWVVRVDYKINLPVASGVSIRDISSRRILTQSIQRQSHIKLHPEESKSAENKLRAIGKQFNVTKPRYVHVPAAAPSLSLDVDIHTAVATEGGRRLVSHLECERDRKIVLTKKKQATLLDCEVCGFSFSRAYGSAASDYCEIHHLLPLSNVKHRTQTKLEDLAILCANCHRVIHLRNPPYTLPQVRNMIAK